MAGPLQIRCGVGMLACTLLCSPASSQQEPPPLDVVLTHLEANYLEYVHSVPNLFCDEHVTSAYGPVGSFVKPLRAVTESTFRLQRVVGPDKKTTLRETRDVKTVNGKPVVTEKVAGPSILFGVFGSALGLVSTAETRCTKYKLHSHFSGSKPANRRIVIDFATLPKRERDPACGTRESDGRAFIDPETLRLRHIEVKTTGYEILPDILGEWDWSADYEPVLFDGKPFWLPRTIDSTAIPYGRNAMAYTFTAQYTGCHQLAVKSRILTGVTNEVIQGSDTPPSHPTPP